MLRQKFLKQKIYLVFHIQSLSFDFWYKETQECGRCFILKEQSYITYSRTTYVGVFLFALPALLSTWLNKTEYSAMRKLTPGAIKGTEIHTDVIVYRQDSFVHVFFRQLQELCATSPNKFQNM
jgi:hypothetical protein